MRRPFLHQDTIALADVPNQAVRFAGLGAEIAAQITEHCFGTLKAPAVRLGAPFAPVPFAGTLESVYQPGVEEIVGAVRGLVGSAD